MNHNSNTPMMGQLTVEDPDEFNRRQRFKEIHDARQRVVTELSTDEKLWEGSLGAIPHRTMSRMSTLVALYVIELKPLLHNLEAGTRYGEDRLPDHFDTEDLGHFALSMGRTSTIDGCGAPPSMIETMAVFQLANQAFAELGMELDLSDGDKDASFDYSDLLDDDAQPAEPPEIPET
jgi:hypothetical protein